MNYNANAGLRPTLGRKVKRVSDVNAMGGSIPRPNTSAPSNSYAQPAQFPNGSDFSQPGFSDFAQFGSPPQYSAPGPQYVPQQPQMPQMPQMPQHMQQSHLQPQQQPVGQFGMFNQPIVQDMAFQYGQQLASQGKTMVKQEIEKFVPVSKLKYYFAVDTKYVVSKLKLVLFPFAHKDWSIKYQQDNPVQPRFEVNAPDLYIPFMGYVTYVLVAGLVLGMQQKFTPEQIGITASSALAWAVVEMGLFAGTLYVANIQTTLRTLDLLAYSGYKYVGIICSILASIPFRRTGYYGCLVYSGTALSVFLVRSLKAQVLSEPTPSPSSVPYDRFDSGGQNVGRKRKMYFLLFVAVTQLLLSWWLSFYLAGGFA